MITSYKSIFRTMLFLLGLAATFQSCDDDVNQVNADIRQTFDTKFPNAEMVEWEKSGKNFKANFYVNRVEKEALFSKSGEWIMTETDISFSETPSEVQDAINQSDYKTWTIDDVDYMETPIDTYYRFDLEKGNSEKIVNISPSGAIL